MQIVCMSSYASYQEASCLATYHETVRHVDLKPKTGGCVAMTIWLNSCTPDRHCLNTVAAERTIMAVAEQLSG